MRCGIDERKGFDTSGKSLASLHHRKNLKSPRRETGRGFFRAEGREVRKAPHHRVSTRRSAGSACRLLRPCSCTKNPDISGDGRGAVAGDMQIILREG